jgi:FkbM family methyltransferase
MIFYDYIEVGTSDFDTEIDKKDNKIGISVEPIKFYLDRLQNKDQCIKINIGISDYNGKANIYYIPLNNIELYNLPDWVRGCNSINSYHQTVYNLCQQYGLNIEEISDNYEIDVLTLYQMMKNNNTQGVYFLKIDTEGYDTKILKKYYQDNDSNIQLPHVILFESNVLINKNDIDEVIDLYLEKGYDLIFRNNDTQLQLNLKKVKNKSMFTEGIKKYYIMDYPLNYDILNLPHENTLESAKEYCIDHNCSGITFQDNIYQVRDGKYIQYYDDKDIISWIYL